MPDAPRTPALAAEHLERVYTTRAGETVGVRGVSLSIARGETVALLGPNGSGKSTLLGMLATIDAPGKGSVSYQTATRTVTIDASAGNAARRHARAALGVVFQTHTLDPLLTVRENLLIAASLHAVPDAPARIDQRLAELRITDRAGDRVGTLSGGLARRADLARALLHGPTVLLLDEPTTGLDPEARADLLDTLNRLARSTDTHPEAPAILHTTHLTDEAERADRVLIMNRGVIAAQGTPASLCAALGERTLTIEHGPHDAAAARERLIALGLSPSATDDRRTTASLDEHDAERAVPQLLADGVRLRVGPPSLADVYAATVGRDAAQATGEQQTQTAEARR